MNNYAKFFMHNATVVTLKGEAYSVLEFDGSAFVLRHQKSGEVIKTKLSDHAIKYAESNGR